MLFRAVAGDTILVDDSFKADPERDDQGRATNTIARCDPIPHPDGVPIVVPCMPCLDIISENPSTDVSSWPAEIRQPLLKTHEANPGEPKAFASGCRSACAKVGGKWYRLKGSGNNSDGFILKDDKDKDGKVLQRQVRGSAFIHTAIRENYMANVIEGHLAKSGIPGANGAMGYYLYTGADELPLGKGDHFQPGNTMKGLQYCSTSIFSLEFTVIALLFYVFS
jgi:hypothetical protein